eukprot:CAMPEP_0197444774 /NCGR_PEP_ID=MMETSP1175-20131217/10165_1 /TAXON_ID=1003142 /ORGANISM="Triceratium dubium, Strain CCMP147" /LENGTH=314 /DNA_ID=CAMNT_0042975621 /DNA_START=114 /DNA_END=1058 /DNA_ORIENTATION=-
MAATRVLNVYVLITGLVPQCAEGFTCPSRSIRSLAGPQRVGSSPKEHLCLFAAGIEEPESVVDTESREISSVTSRKAEDENPRKTGLALMLDDGTRKSHSVAQNSAFVSGFFKGIGTKSAFATLVTSLYFVYDAMEEVFDQTSNEYVQYLDSSELRRVPSLEQDMEYFYGSSWKDLIVPSRATKAYVQRVKDIADTEPYLLIAHQYTRYLGDLFGGQMMGGMATRSLGLESGKGTAFYTFNDIPSTEKFITNWYTKLNELALTEEQKEAIVEEANLVFDLNIGILEELEGSPIRAMVMLALNSLKSKFGLSAEK